MQTEVVGFMKDLRISSPDQIVFGCWSPYEDVKFKEAYLSIKEHCWVLDLWNHQPGVSNNLYLYQRKLYPF